MKFKTLILSSLIIVTLLVSSCTVATAETHVDISCEQFQNNDNIQNDFDVSPGETITIELCSNPTTGYKWKYETIGKIILKETSYKFIEPGDAEAVGASGKEVWTFEVVETGKTELRMEYTRPWEGGEQAEWTYNVTVTAD